LVLSSLRLQKPPISIIPYPQETTGISQVAVSIAAGTVMVIMVSISAGNPRTNLGLQPTRRNGKRRNRRSLGTLVLGRGLEVAKQMEINMNGLSLVVKRVTNNPWAVELRSSTMFGICSARAVDGTVPIPLAFMLPFHQIHLHFLQLYLLPIPIISELPRSSARILLHHLLLLLLLQAHLRVRTLLVWSPSIRLSF